MGSEARAVARLAAIFAAGGVAALGWSAGLYATATLALIAAAWMAASSHIALRRRNVPPPPAPTSAGDDARERRRLAAYLDLSPAPLIAFDAGDRMRVVNRAARRLFGTDDLLPDPPATLTSAIAAAAPGRAARVRIDTGGGVHSFAILTADLGIGGASVGGAPIRVAALIDIDAELKAAEAQALRDLLQVLSHEITNTLTPIASLARTAAQMLAEPKSDRAAIGDAVETVARRAEGLQRFGEAYRALARLPTPVIVPVRLEPLIDDLARLFATRWPGVTLTLDVKAAPAAVPVDADQLVAALWALLQNAAEVATSVVLDVRMAVGAVEFTISDNGPGIPAANAESIFQPFFTTKPEGSGVGLALARQIFRAHGGDLLLIANQPARFAGALLIKS